MAATGTLLQTQGAAARPPHVRNLRGFPATIFDAIAITNNHHETHIASHVPS